jgi:hypothetical protein
MKLVILFSNNNKLQTEILVFSGFSSNVLVELRFRISVSYIKSKYWKCWNEMTNDYKLLHSAKVFRSHGNVIYNVPSVDCKMYRWSTDISIKKKNPNSFDLKMSIIYIWFIFHDHFIKNQPGMIYTAFSKLYLRIYMTYRS